MLSLSKIERKNKRALSNLVAYVLLISITISLSVMVYSWLKFYVEAGDGVECPANVNVIIDSYECTSGAGGNLTVTLKNKGLFSVDGFVLRVHDRVDADFGFYAFDSDGFVISPGVSNTTAYLFSDYNTANPSDNVESVTFVDVQPFVEEDGNRVACEAYSSQRIVCA